MTKSFETNDEGAEQPVHQDVPADLDSRVVQTSADESFIAADRAHEAGLDAATGCEFVDDRIRLMD